MSKSIVLTDGATFKCPHMVAAIGVTEGITISLKASKIKVGDSKPILNGATISGFTTEKGCTFQVSGTPTPCQSFELSLVPASGLLSEGSQKVYIEADKSAIATIPATGNAQVGLTIIETQTQLKA